MLPSALQVPPEAIYDQVRLRPCVRGRASHTVAGALAARAVPTRARTVTKMNRMIEKRLGYSNDSFSKKSSSFELLNEESVTDPTYSIELSLSKTP